MPSHSQDAKSSALRQHRCLHPRPHLVTDELFVTNAFFDPRDLLQVKYEMLRRVARRRLHRQPHRRQLRALTPLLLPGTGCLRGRWLGRVGAQKARTTSRPQTVRSGHGGGPADAGSAAAGQGRRLGRTGAPALRHLDTSAQHRTRPGATGKKTAIMMSTASNPELQDQVAAPQARYEQLRDQVVSRHLSSSRLALAVVFQAGLAAWIEQWAKLPSPPPLRSPAADAVTLPETVCAPLVQVLSAMALSHLPGVSA